VKIGRLVGSRGSGDLGSRRVLRSFEWHQLLRTTDIECHLPAEISGDMEAGCNFTNDFAGSMNMA
jgi:hypothetical protein